MIADIKECLEDLGYRFFEHGYKTPDGTRMFTGQLLSDDEVVLSACSHFLTLEVLKKELFGE